MMILNSMLIRRGLPVTLVMATVIMMQAPAASAGGGHFSLAIGFHYPFYGHHHGHHFGPYRWGHRVYLDWPYRVGPCGYPPVVVPAVAPEAGAVKLRVSPKKTQVFVDGTYAGTAGKFDGYPGYLWLQSGSYTLTFYREGYRTFEHVVEVHAGMITDLRIEMVPGESAPPPTARSVPPAAGRAPPVDRTPPAPTDRPSAPAPQRRSGEPIVDLRADGGRVRLFVEPEDASVYLDGRFLGTGAELRRLHDGLLLEVGEHRLEVVHPGYRADRLTFRIDAGEELEVRIELDPPGSASS